MSHAPLADGLSRRKAYRAMSVIVGGLGIAITIYGFVASAVAAIVIGLVLFVVVGFAFHVAANVTMNNAISRAAEAAGGSARGSAHGAEYIPAIHGLHIDAFQQARLKSAMSGQPIDDAFRFEMARLTSGG